MARHKTPVLDREAFDEFADLFDDEELRDVIEQWRADSAAALDAIAGALARDDRARIGEVAHRTGGGGLALGATALARACEGLRVTAESGGPMTDADIAQLRAAVEATYAALTAAAAPNGW
jgi:HPt (histidine-containing phosphotransfer) domain-containing protein